MGKSPGLSTPDSQLCGFFLREWAVESFLNEFGSNKKLNDRGYGSRFPKSQSQQGLLDRADSHCANRACADWPGVNGVSNLMVPEIQQHGSN